MIGVVLEARLDNAQGQVPNEGETQQRVRCWSAGNRPLCTCRSQRLSITPGNANMWWQPLCVVSMASGFRREQDDHDHT